MRLDSYTHVFRLPIDRRTAFDLFSNPRHLDALTPPWFRLEPKSPLPEVLDAGLEISYSLRWRGIPIPWTSRLTDWHPPESFSYEQKIGPYRFFRHDHHFTAVRGGTEIRDHASFRAPGGAWADRFIAGPELRRIFEYRARRAAELLDLQAPGADSIDASLMPLTSASSSAIERPT